MTEFGEFYLGSKDTVFRTVLAATGDRSGAEDAVAEAYARAYARWPRVHEHPNPVGWVIIVALNAQLLRRTRLGEPLEPIHDAG